jgi:hypothetical protein
LDRKRGERSESPTGSASPYPREGTTKLSSTIFLSIKISSCWCRARADDPASKTSRGWVEFLSESGTERAGGTAQNRAIIPRPAGPRHLPRHNDTLTVPYQCQSPPQKAGSLSHHCTIWRPMCLETTSMDQFAGMVRTGACGVTPVSASEKNIIRNEKIRFEAKSPSSIQYHVSRYRMAA